MKISLLFLIFCFVVFQAGAQGRLTVTYQAQNLVLTNQHDVDGNRIYCWQAPPRASEFELAVNNKFSSFRSIYGAELASLHHQPLPDPTIAYTDLNAGYNYQPVVPLTRKSLMVRDSVRNFKWFFSHETDTICGFPCRMATAVSGTGYVYAWYAYELPSSFGPFFYTGLPGTILRVEFSNYTTRYIATRISDLSPDVAIPDANIIAADQYAAIMKEKRSYRGGFFGKKTDPLEVPRINSWTRGLGRNSFRY